MIKRIGFQEFMEGNQEVSPTIHGLVYWDYGHVTTGLSLLLHDDGNPLAWTGPTAVSYNHMFGCGKIRWGYLGL